MIRVIALLTAHNRAATTVECLSRLEASARRAGVALSACLVDDGSTDGTSELVRGRHDWVRLIQGDGSLFWNRGMHRAMADGMSMPHDYLLWLNDDTLLEPDALERLLATASAEAATYGRPVLVVGATADHASGRLTYGGMATPHRWRPFAYEKVGDVRAPVACDTMNGNVVLLPAAVVRDVGNLDPAFEHAMGDIDYGLRARRRGHPIVVAAGIVGRCNANAVAGSHDDLGLPLRVRWRKLVGRKGVPPRSWLRLTRRHGGWLWPLYFAWPYAKLLASGRKRRAPRGSPGAHGA